MPNPILDATNARIESINQQLNAIIQTQGTLKPERSLAQVETDKDSFVLNPTTSSEDGPLTNNVSNTTYHDFYSLQVAFEEIWTELFDEELRNMASSFFHRWARYDNRQSGIESSENPLIQIINDTQQGFGNHPEMLQYVTQYLTNAVTEAQEVLNLMQMIVADPLEQNEGEQNVQRIVLYIEKYRELIEMSNGLQTKLLSKYKFDVFAANSLNLGILLNYRQKWDFKCFQVGDLVSTIPLTPKESRKYSKKWVTKKSRSVKEMESSLKITKSESSNTGRVESEIVNKAMKKTNFKIAAQAGVSAGVFSASTSTSFDQASENDSSDTKKDFRESVLKAAQEYKQEHKIELEQTSSEEMEETTTLEITNPNDEIPVTYLFYELERRYQLSEHLHKITPVILVANEVPNPSQITNAWLIANDWIIRRTILDRDFLRALDYVTNEAVGDKENIENLREQMNQNKTAYETTRSTFETQQRTITLTNNLIDQQKLSGMLLSEDARRVTIGELLTGEALEDFNDLDESKHRIEYLEEILKRAKDEMGIIKEDYMASSVAYQQAVDKFNAANTVYLNKIVQVDRLKLHIKENILYYMQAIWDYEPADQRYFRLYNIEVPWFKINDTEAIEIPPDADLGTKLILAFFGAVARAPFIEEKRKLYQVADLDKPLGYKGNYMMFPLKEHNDLTTVMMSPYIELAMNEVILRDTDELSDEFKSLTSEEIIETLRNEVAALAKENRIISPEREGQYKNALYKRLTSTQKEKDTVIVPTDSLYIDAIPGAHPLLEEFKLKHRALDILKVKAEVAKLEMENTRYMARILNSELTDPDTERTIVFGDGKDVVINPSTN